MTKIEFEVHESHAQMWTNKNWRYCILMGGRGNGRSGSASRYSISRLTSTEYTRGTLMRATREDIRASCWQAINDRMIESEAHDAKGLSITSGDMMMKYGSNSLQAFGFKASSGSLTARLKSLEGFNYAWIEEAEEIEEGEFMKFDDSLRIKNGRIQIVLSLNTPAVSHWILKRWFNMVPHPDAPGFFIPVLKPEFNDVVLFIAGTWRENLPNLDEATVARYQNYKVTKPEYYWQVIEGLAPETVLGKIYSGWREINEIPFEARLVGHYLDFGFDPDPAAIGSVYYHNGGYIVDEKLYANELTNPDLARHLKLLPPAPIIADSAEPKSIEELKRLGINVVGCEKGPDSVYFGIKHVQGIKISYTKASINIKREYENYAWKVDKEGNTLGIEDPKCANHHMAGIRYFMMEMVKSGADPEAVERAQVRSEVREKHRVSQVSNRLGV